ncbi:hypothetical protein ACH79_07690 [Bradyrhizobium sp. CCBAU 051011]|uniref:hypothetical protein n=1 Tax=Bradyrhizobium sp. CCBAU 051011 TaxID=858422 RepID=UPI0013744EFA|nr:hypothetical protein [Bradyrhizobium sp. CCBAU 051011]QHO72518.1 hypothetical protein ACH79_07690 [Bradyrhizobium sp. CCBAU 051011]
MNVSGQDISQTLEFRSTTAIVRLLPTGLLLIFLGLLIYALVDLDREPWTIVGIVLCWVLGAGLVAVTLWRRSNPGKPLFTLSPAGIHYRIPFVKEVLIPWREIQAIGTIDVEATYWSFFQFGNVATRNLMILRDVTVVLLSKSFYDQRIFVDSPILRGPGWSANFIPKGSQVQMALHHELVSVEPKALREAVEARWLAFRDTPAAGPARTSVPSVVSSVVSSVTASPGTPSVAKAIMAPTAPKPDVVAMGENPRAISRWDTVKITALLIGIAVVLTNLTGLWQMPGQAQERQARAEKSAKAREQQKYWAETIKRQKEESKKLEAEARERQERFEQDMRRTFGR